MFSQDCRNFHFFDYNKVGHPSSFMLIGYLYLFFYILVLNILFAIKKKIVDFNNSSHCGSGLVKCQTHFKLERLGSTG